MVSISIGAGGVACLATNQLVVGGGWLFLSGYSLSNALHIMLREEKQTNINKSEAKQ